MEEVINFVMTQVNFEVVVNLYPRRAWHDCTLHRSFSCGVPLKRSVQGATGN